MSAPQIMTEPEQRELTRLCMLTAQLLMQHGAECALVESITIRLGTALGLDNVHLGITAHALSLTTVSGDHCITTIRRNHDHGINMLVVTEVQRLVLHVEKEPVPPAQIRARLESVGTDRYPKWLVSLLIGLSCASFARLTGADWASCALTAVASSVAMAVRQFLSVHHFNPLVNFTVTAFVATSISCLATKSDLFQTPNLAMAASVLLLIPGFPLINSVSDMVKGYINTGIARGMMALLLILASSVGILLALVLWRVQIWI